MLFTTVICNQQTRSPLNPLVSSMNVAGEMELWLMHGLFCLRDRGCVCDFWSCCIKGGTVCRNQMEVSVDTQLIRSKSVRAVRLISLLNDDLLPVCACLFPSTTRFDPNNRY